MTPTPGIRRRRRTPWPSVSMIVPSSSPPSSAPARPKSGA
jgi:hypothetical protein